jgi:hypothetical protein
MKSCHTRETSLSSRSESAGTLERMATTAAAGTCVSQRTCGGHGSKARDLGGKDRWAMEGKDGRRQQRLRKATTDDVFLESIGLFSEDSGNCMRESANVHSQVGGLKSEINPHHWMVILR